MYSKTNDNDHIVSQFEAQVVRYPGSIALRDKEIEYTYQDLNSKVNQFTACLKARSVKAGDFVAVYLEPSTDFILCILSILKVGAAYVPLDISAPANRLNDILTDAAPKLALTTSTQASVFQSFQVEVCLVEQLHKESIIYPNTNLNTSIFPDSPSYMMYTSGTTGKPKGVIVPHRGVINLVRDNALNIGPMECMAQFSNLAFDGSTFDIWTPLLYGSTLVIIQQDVRGNYQKLRILLESYQIKYLFLPTSYLHQLASSHPETLDMLDKILVGGEQINAQIIKTFIAYRKAKQLPIYLVNGYGPTETTGHVCRQIIDETSKLSDEYLSSIGKPIKNVELYILDEALNPVSEGELCISGMSLALGYHHPALGDEKFISNPFRKDEPYSKLYRTGDKVKRSPTGDYVCLGRFDDQVKIGGFRVHLNEIEQALMQHVAIQFAAVTLELGGGMHKLLTAYLVLTCKNALLKADTIRLFLKKKLPPYMIPAKYVVVDQLPLTSTGKIDKKNLDKMSQTNLSFHDAVSSGSQIEETIKQIWQYLLNRQQIEVDKNLFELGANSLLLTEACSRINKAVCVRLRIADLLAYPTIRHLSDFLEGNSEMTPERSKHTNRSDDIAIIGMSCRFPKANGLDEFWERLCQGEDCLTRFDIQDADGMVSVRGILTDIEKFDAAFFGFSPMDASIADPQQRLFLECTWEALEHAAVAPGRINTKLISVFAGMSDSTYLHENLLNNNWASQELDALQQRIATSTSMLSTQISYRLNLKGKSVNVNTACSTGLIAVEQACQDLLLGQSDIALAGASSIVVPQMKPYSYQSGSIVSPDGYCRPFSDKANGTVFSNGVGVVVLKRLQDAIEDSDTIYAVIKGRGVSNDGMDKLGFSAPSVHGQMSCIREALSTANINPEDIGLLEAHGTATALGDVIEISALTSTYREQTDKSQYCALGSVKANIGHTDVAAGIAGLIKTALCLYYKKIPPLLHFNYPNTNLSLNNSPFFINTTLIDWNSEGQRYAGVSSFGVGGTNIHLILSEYVKKRVHESSNEEEVLLLLSAKTEKSLEQTTQQFSYYLSTTKQSLRDVAYTLQTGRENFKWRRFSVGKTVLDIQENLKKQPTVALDETIQSNIVFLFSGQGSQYPRMAMELMESIPRLKNYLKKGMELAKPYLNLDLLTLLRDGNSKELELTEYAQPALFIIEYAIARLLMDCGVYPTAFIGHSLGEYVAACLSGVFSFEDAIALICKRGRLMANAPKGGMLAIECDVETCLVYQKIADVELALHNSNNHCVVAGSTEAINKLEQHLIETRQVFQRLKVSHAFHSRLMEPLEQSFKALFTDIILSPPSIPIMSNVTGDWLLATEAMDPNYWYCHLRQTVQFCKGIEHLLSNKHFLFIETGPGQSMCQLVKSIANGSAKLVHTLPNHHQKVSDYCQLLTGLGEIWANGISINFEPLYEKRSRQRVSLPTYPFQRQRYWLEPDHQSPLTLSEQARLYKPVWSSQKAYLQSVLLSSERLQQHSWIIFTDKSGLGEGLMKLLKRHSIQPIVIVMGTHYEQHLTSFTINPKEKSHYQVLFRSIKDLVKKPIVFHTVSYPALTYGLHTTDAIDEQLTLSLYSVVYLAQAYVEIVGEVPLKLNLITSGTQRVLGAEAIHPARATLQACRVIGQEYEAFEVKLIDLNPDELPESNLNLLNKILDLSLQDLKEFHTASILAYRNGYQWVLMYTEIPKIQQKINRLKERGVYLLTGGLGGIALSCCEAIIETVSSPTFILFSRRSFIPKNEWEHALESKIHPQHETINKLLELEKLGAKCFIYQVDITQGAHLGDVVHQCITRFGKIDGLIHTAGVVNPGLISTRSQSVMCKVLAPKIHGTHRLCQVFRDIPLDFVVLHSSLAALLGGFQQLDYCAANAGLDAFAKSDLFPSSKFTLTINWNTWEKVGMAAKAAHRGELTFLGQGNDISPKQGKTLFLEALSGQDSQVAVSNVAIRLDTPMRPIVSFSAPCTKIERQNLTITTPFDAPFNDTEIKLAQLWEDALGITKIGRFDNFFALGGHSLKALGLIEKINKAFNCSISTSQLYSTPTIKTLGAVVVNDEKKSNSSLLTPLKKIKKSPSCLFLCHPVIGLIDCFKPFVEQSDLPFSIYGLQAPDMGANNRLYESLLLMAEDYCAAIKTIQPKGPYFLMGYSFGGNVLYEVAHVLQQQGEEIKLLAMIDSWSVHSQVQQDESYFKTQLQRLKLPESLLDLAWKREKLLLNHVHSNLNQDIVLFKAAHLLDDYQLIDCFDNGWSICNRGRIRCYKINGDHNTIMNAENIKTILHFIHQEIVNTTDLISI